MKRITSIFLILCLLLSLAACTPTEQSSGSGVEILSNSMKNSSETASVSKDTSSNTADEPTVTSEVSTASSGSSSVSSVTKNPYISQNEAGQTIHINPAPKKFEKDEELFQYLRTVDLREKGFDVIADENVCLIPKLVDHPKSKPAKTKIVEQVAITSKTGGGPLIWGFLDAPGSWCYSVVWRTSKKDLYKPITISQDLYDIVENIKPYEELQLITKGEQHYIYIDIYKDLYWMYEDKYLVQVSDYTNTLNADELILLAEDFVFEKHKLK